MNPRPKILIVDDEPFNVDYLEQELEDLDYDTVSAADGRQALDQVAAEWPDLVLLDIMMPIMDGFEVLGRLKADAATRDIPVIIISANNDMPSVVRGIQLGAEDYLPKPFDPVLLHARLNASLDKKRLRDQEVEYLRQVQRLTDAAAAVESDAFEGDSLRPVAERPDALGNLARVFQRMAHEVHAREQRLRRQIEQLRLDIEERQQAAAETVAVYIPMDRRQALARGESLPDRTHGAALLADISGFTPLTEALAKELGFQRGAEELSRHLNRVYSALIDEVHRQGGSVVYFSGDAITCWFDEKAEDRRLKDESESSFSLYPSSFRAVACALSMQAAMQAFATITTPVGAAISLAIKVAVTAGPARRFVVGDPRIQQIEVLGGRLLDHLAEAEGLAERGEVLVHQRAAEALGEQLAIAGWRGEERYAVVTGLAGEKDSARVEPWPNLAPEAISEAQARAWVLAPVYEKVSTGKSDLLAELRPAAALFLKFGGLDYDGDDAAGEKLDAFVRWVQAVVDGHDGAVLQLTVGDKGSYLYAVFGAPVAHYDDALHAARAALALAAPPAELGYITGVQVGVAYGQTRAGAYGSATQRTYAAMGDKTNLAARLMMAATEGVLCDEAVYQAAQGQMQFEALPPMQVKGKAERLAVYRPTGAAAGEAAALGATGTLADRALLLDRLSPEDQLTLKAASVIGRVFTVEVLREIYPDERERASLAERLEALEELSLIARHAGGPGAGAAYSFSDPLMHQTAYNLMLFAQRRQLHRAIAEWHERAHAADLAPYYAALAHHWRRAEDNAKAAHYLEQAGERSRQSGDYEEALRAFNESLALDGG